MNLTNFTRRPVVKLNLDDHCRRAAELMKDFHIRHLPVVDQEVPVGMLSERKLLTAIGWWGNRLKHPEIPISDWAQRLPVSEVMSTPLVCLLPEETPDKAARLMIDKKISAVALVSDGRLRGIVTEADFLRYCTGEAWQQQTVMEHMRAHVFQVAPEELIRQAWHLMREKRIRHLVVMKNDNLQGILSDRDLLAGITWDATGPEGIQDQVQHIMTKRVATIEPEATLAQTAQRMLDRKIGALPVTVDGHLAGIITETDLLQALVREIVKG
jgi:CBS domain-containing protein